METILKESLYNYGHHSTKAITLSHALSQGQFSDADYLATTFPVMVQHFHSHGISTQPVIFCLADTLAEIKEACMRAFGAEENSSVGVEVLWAYNNLPGMDARSLTMSERNVRATLRILKVRAGLDSLKVAHIPYEVDGRY